MRAVLAVVVAAAAVACDCTCPDVPPVISGSRSEFTAGPVDKAEYSITGAAECRRGGEDPTFRAVVTGKGAELLYDGTETGRASALNWLGEVVAPELGERNVYWTTAGFGVMCDAEGWDAPFVETPGWSHASVIALEVAGILAGADLEGDVLVVVRGEVPACTAGCTW